MTMITITKTMYYFNGYRYYGEFHDWLPVTGWTTEEKRIMEKNFKEDIEKIGVKLIDWAAQYRRYEDFDQLHPIKVTVLVLRGHNWVLYFHRP